MNRSLHPLIPALFLVALIGALASCGEDAPPQVDLKVYPAQYDTAPDEEPPAGWQRVTFPGNLRSRAVSVLVSSEPLLTGWSFVAVHIAEESDGSRALGVRLNAYGQGQMKQFCSDEQRLKQPLALQMDGRWVDVSPLLKPVTDRMTLFGFTAEEATKLDRWLETR